MTVKGIPPMTLNKCLYCGTEFEPKRKTAKFCSDNCRKYYNSGKKSQPDPGVSTPVGDVTITPTPDSPKQESSESTDIVLTKTDKLFESHNPGYYKFFDELFSRSCLMCGTNFTTHLSACRVCSPKCKEDALHMLVTMK